MDSGLCERVRARGLEIGFEEIAFSAAGRARGAEAFQRWVDRGFAGEMAYMARDPASRADITLRSPWIRSVVSAAMSYAPPREVELSRRAPGSGIAGLIARYAVGRDYHTIVKRCLEELARFIRSESGGRAEVRTAVDSSAILERAHAVAGGLGWTGKNTMAILQKTGSYFFLGEILTDLDLPSGAPLEDRCGSCTRCIDACPTGAILEPYLLDARRCISYLTIELKGAIPSPQREAIGHHLLGCDVCQEVCPWNSETPPTRERELRPSRAVGETTLADAVAIDEAGFKERFGRSSISRAKRTGFVRNALIVAANREDGEALAAGIKALADSDAIVREAAVWALARGGETERRAAARAADGEQDPSLRRRMHESLER